MESHTLCVSYDYRRISRRDMAIPRGVSPPLFEVQCTILRSNK